MRTLGGMTVGRAVLLALTLGAVALGVRSLSAPPPLEWALAAVLVYAGVLVAGALLPNLGMYGELLSGVPEAEGLVALTFDDGPHPETTTDVLRVLAERGVRATFFVIGKKVDEYPEIVRRIVEAGHEVGVHGYDHFRGYAFLSPRAVQADIERTREAIRRASGAETSWFRPPIGQASPRTFAGAERAGAVVVGWSVRPRDGLRSATPSGVVERVRRGLRAGAIVLLHDAWERGPATPGPAGVRALAEILDECERRGLEPVTLGDLVSASDVGR